VSDTPTIAVLISTFNEEPYIERCLEAVIRQDYPAERVTIWLIDGGSTDATVALAERIAGSEPRLRVIASGARLNLPAALNLGIQRSDGDFVAKVDARTFVEPDFLSRAVAAFESGDAAVACVGGRPEQQGETRFAQAVARARTSRFGVGGSEYAGTSERTAVDTVQCGVYRRAPLVEVGCFDPAMQYGEDEELNWRLRGAGYAILLDTAIRFRYVTRPSWRAAYRQYRNYGEARTRVLEKHPDFLRPHHLVPPAAVAIAATVTMLAPLSAHARRGVAGLGLAYGTAAAAAAGRAAGRDLGDAARVALAFTALHAGYGVGMLSGFRRRIAERGRGG
jgi:succinoglycan biosynthesis protein ExoA